MLKNLSDKYDQLKKSYPEAKLALDIAPYSGTVTSALDTAQDVYKGNYEDAAENAVGIIPGLKAGVLLKKGRKAAALKNATDAVRAAARVTDSALDAGSYQKTEGRYARGGRVTGYRGYGKAKKV